MHGTPGAKHYVRLVVALACDPALRARTRATILERVGVLYRDETAVGELASWLLNVTAGGRGPLPAPTDGDGTS